jgi:putative transposase
MIRTMNLKTRREILNNIRNQYQESDWLGKTKLLDGFMSPEIKLLALDVFAETWDSKYPQISRTWRKHWEN